MKTINIYNKRLSKYLYSLGFNREIRYNKGKEIWVFEDSERLQESLRFYFRMRDKNKQEMLL